MRIISPDEALTAAVGGLLAVPQRRGVPLPLATMALSFVPVVGHATSLAAAILLVEAIPPRYETNGWPLVAVFAFATLFASFASLVRVRRCTLEARNWGPDLAASARAHAVRSRETQSFARYMLLVVTIATACATCLVLDDIGHVRAGFMMGMVGLGLTITSLGNLLVRHGDCCPPRDQGEGLVRGR